MKIQSTRKFLLISCVVIFLVSCQKEISIELGSQGNGGGGGTGGGTGGNNTSIIGNWNFVGMVAHTNSSVSLTAGGDQLKTITTSDYVTQNNVGTMQITASQFISSNIAYSIDTTMHVKTYLNGVLFDEMDLPFVLTSPSSSSTSPYTRINNDSLTITGALGVPDPSGSTPTGPVGVRISWSGDTLLLKVASSFTQTVTQGGVPATVTGSVTGITKLKRQ
jgi:hypothetical protein